MKRHNVRHDFAQLCSTPPLVKFLYPFKIVVNFTNAGCHRPLLPAASSLHMKLSTLSALVFIPAVAVADVQTPSLRGEEEGVNEQASAPHPTNRVLHPPPNSCPSRLHMEATA